LATPWTVAYQSPLFIGSPRQKYWSGLPCPPPGDLPDPEVRDQTQVCGSSIEDGFFFIAEPPGEPAIFHFLNWCSWILSCCVFNKSGASKVVQLGKNLPTSAGVARDAGLILGSGRSPEGWHGNQH